MEIKQWRCFVVLAEIGNIRRAASLLAMSQPALSVRLQHLEEAVGYALFERAARGVSLTERGRRLLPHAKELLARAAETEESARAIGRGAIGRLEIGITPVAALSLFPGTARRFGLAHPGVALAVTEGLSHELEDAVARRQLDIAIVHTPSSRDDLVVREVARERFVAAVPATHALAGAQRIAPQDLRDEVVIGVRRDVGPVTFDHIVGWFARAGVTLQISQVATSSISTIGLVAAGLGIGLVVESLDCIAMRDVRYIALDGDPPGLGFALCHRSDMPGELCVAFERALQESVVERSR